MTLATVDEIVDAEIVLNDEQAEEFDLRFQYALGGYAEARQELIECVQCVRGSNVAERLGFKSRGDYIADRVANLNVKWAVEDRRSLVELMAYDKDGGMSTRQIGSALGVNNATVSRDMAGVANATPERTVQGSDGKTYTQEAKPEPTVSERDWPEVPEPAYNAENRDTGLANGLRNDSLMVATRYIDFINGIAKNLPGENLAPEANAYVAQALRDNLAEIAEATERAIAKIEGEGK